MNTKKCVVLILTLFGIFCNGILNALTIMPMGDSITAGADFYTNSNGGYRDPLYRDLAASGITFTFMGAVNGAGNGSSTIALAAAGEGFHNGYGSYRIDGITSNLSANNQPTMNGQSYGDGNQGGYWLTGGGTTTRSAELPDIVLLQIGTNDILQHYDSQTASPTEAQFETDMEARLNTLVTTIHSLSPNSIIFVAAIPSIYGSTGFDAEIQAYNSYIKNTLVPNLSYTRFVDNNTPLLLTASDINSVDPALLGTDGIHPNRFGYPILALNWAAAIRTYLGNNPANYNLTVASGTLGNANGASSASYPVGSVVTVKSNAASSGNQFAVWSPNTLSNPYWPIATYVMPAAATTITASYEATTSTLIPNGTYDIVNTFYNYLSVAANGTSSGSQVQQQTYTGASTQNWTLNNLGNNVVSLVVSGTSMALEVPGGSTTNGTYLDIAGYTGATYQQWTLTPVLDAMEIVNVNSGEMVDTGYNTSSGSRLDEYIFYGNRGEYWAFYPVSSGGTTTYSLTVNSGTGSGNYAAGTVVNVTANAPQSGYQFAAWTGSISALANPASASTTLTMPASAAAITATYTQSGSIPAIPTGLTATAGSAQVSLSWTASSGATSYNVYRGTSTNSESTTAVATGVGTTSYTDTGLTNGTAYYYKVAAVNSVGTSSLSGEVSATPTSGGGGGTYSAQITWGAAQVMLGNADVSTTGTAFDAATFNASAVSVNGVTFNHLASSGSTINGSTAYTDGTISANSPGNAPGAYGSAFSSASPSSTAYSALTSTIGFGYFNDGTVVISGLTIGRSYQVQVWSYYSGSSGSTNTTLTGANTVTLDPHTGEFAIGTFTAATSSITFNYDYASAYGLINAVSVRDITSSGGSGGTTYPLTVNSGTGSGNYAAGTVVNVAANAPQSGYQFAAWTGSISALANPASASTTLTMPASAAAITATYTQSGSIPAAPTGLTATAGSAQVSLSWTASSGATSYNVYRGTSTNSESTTAIASGISATAYTDSSLVNGTAYYYKVAAVNSVGTSSLSGEVSATPTSGGGGGTYSAQITWGAAQVMLGNADVSTTGTAFDAATFNASAVSVNGVTFNHLASSGSTINGSTAYTDGTISANSPGNAPGAYGGAFSSASPSSTAYSALTSTIGFGYFNDGTVVISGLTIGHSYQVQVWSYYNAAPGNANTTLTGANTVTLDPDTGEFAIGAFTAAASSLSFNYNYGNDYGLINAISVRDITSSGGSGGSAPAAPTNLVATPGNAQVTLTWSASTGATSYNVYRGLSAGGETSLVTGLTSTSYTNTGLSNNTPYYYRVAAVNSYGTSTYSNEVNATPSGGSAPAAPTNLVATAGNAQVSLGWTASSGATSYNVYRGTSTNSESTTAIASGISATAYTDSSLVNGTAYYYKVTAVNTSGMSTYSSEVAATPTSGTGTYSAQITWGAAQSMVGNTDVSATGNAFDAATFHSVGVSVNGVTFNTLGSSNSDGIISITAPGGVGQYTTAFTTSSPSSAAYSQLTDTLGFGYFANGTVTISGLTVGHSYQVQAWSYWNGAGTSEGTTFTAGNTVTLNTKVGQYAVGMFTAAATTASFTYNATGHCIINAVSVRDITH